MNIQIICYSIRNGSNRVGSGRVGFFYLCTFFDNFLVLFLVLFTTFIVCVCLIRDQSLPTEWWLWFKALRPDWILPFASLDMVLS